MYHVSAQGVDERMINVHYYYHYYYYQRLDTRNPCTRYNPLSSDNTAGQQRLTNNPTQRKNERSR